ncbi:unnamed protein product [marine sediment metagenome]|uniref:Uncharacterized protein n=1 Tax=marine sediment metagenome TaxID=412755 RepID=X1TTC9_9ZZZZ
MRVALDSVFKDTYADVILGYINDTETEAEIDICQEGVKVYLLERDLRKLLHRIDEFKELNKEQP